MKTCTFFGHQIAPESCKEKIYSAVENLILNENASKFYVNRHGKFDEMSLSVLRQLKKKYPHIKICVVFENVNYKKDKFGRSKLDDYDDCEMSVFLLIAHILRLKFNKLTKKWLNRQILLFVGAIYPPNFIAVRNVQLVMQKN